MFPTPIENLIDSFSQIPGIGKKTATRYVFYLLKSDEKQIKDFVDNLSKLRKKVKKCSLCFRFFEPKGKEKTCSICKDDARDKSKIMIVKEQSDMEVIENTNKFKGLYFILWGTKSDLNKKETDGVKKRVESLIDRIKESEDIKEIILALDPTPKNKSTSLWLKRKLEDLLVEVTKLGRGLPFGGELEYADKDTLISALENRKK